MIQALFKYLPSQLFYIRIYKNKQIVSLNEFVSLAAPLFQPNLQFRTYSPYSTYSGTTMKFSVASTTHSFVPVTYFRLPSS